MVKTKELETILNILIKKWRKPRWFSTRRIYMVYDEVCIDMSEEVVYRRSINDLCSYNSWLREFVCENELYEESMSCEQWRILVWYMDWYNDDEEDALVGWHTEYENEEYYVMYSALMRDKISFILDNINTDDR